MNKISIPYPEGSATLDTRPKVERNKKRSSLNKCSEQKTTELTSVKEKKRPTPPEAEKAYPIFP